MPRANEHVPRGATFPLCGHKRKGNTYRRVTGYGNYESEGCKVCIRTRKLRQLIKELEHAQFHLGWRECALQLKPDGTRTATTERIKKRVQDAQRALDKWIAKQPWKTNLGGYG